jgi:hypothetical protein
MKLRTLTVLTIIAAVSTAAMAGGGKVKFKFNSQAAEKNTFMIFAYEELALARMTIKMGDRNDKTSVILRDNKIYSVTEADGQQIVMDMAAIGKMAGSAMDKNQSGDFFYSNLISLDKTGKKETVAGIEGDIYKMNWDDNGTLRNSIIVLSKDKHVIDYTKAWIHFGDRMADALDIKRNAENDLREKISKKKVGILRLDDQFVLTSLSTDSPPSSKFELPAEPMAIPDMGALGGMLGGGAAASGDAAGKSAGESTEKKGMWGMISDKLNRQADRQQERTDDVIDDASDEAADQAVGETVDKAVDKVFDIFRKN